MLSIAIYGAGALGGALAHRLAARGRVAEVRLIDPAAQVAGGQALDIRQASGIEGSATRLASGADLADAASADVIVLADAAGAAPGGWETEPGLALLKRIAGFDSDALIVCAGASHRRLVERGAREGGLPRRRLVGSAPAALAAAVRAIVAVEADAAASEVALSLLGNPPDAVVAWSEASISGHALVRALQPPQMARVQARMAHLWPPGPYALAAAAALVCEAADGSSRRPHCCFVVLDGELGVRGTATALPVRIGAAGVVSFDEPTLSTHERVHLDNAIARST